MDFEQGDPVVVYARSFYREPRVGVFIGPCKDHDGAFIVRILNPEAPIKEVCANLSKQDTIERLPTLNPS